VYTYSNFCVLLTLSESYEGWVVITCYVAVVAIYVASLIRRREKEKSKRIAEEKRSELDQVWHDYKLIPLTNETNRRRNQIYKQYFDLEYPETVFKPYYNGCWGCGKKIDSRERLRCPECKWYICSCGRCKLGCGNGTKYTKEYEKEITRVKKMPSTWNVKKRFLFVDSFKREQRDYIATCNQVDLRVTELNYLQDMFGNLYAGGECDENEIEKEMRVLDEIEQIRNDPRMSKAIRSANDFDNPRDELKHLEEALRDAIIQEEVARKKEEIIRDSEIRLKRQREELEQEKIRKREKKFKTVYEEKLAYDKNIVGFNELPHKVELSLDISLLRDDEVEGYLTELMKIIDGYLVVMKVIVNNEKKKDLVKQFKCERIQKCTSYSGMSNVLTLLIEAGSKATDSRKKISSTYVVKEILDCVEEGSEHEEVPWYESFGGQEKARGVMGGRDEYGEVPWKEEI